MRLVIQSLQWLFKYTAILCLGLLLAIGLMQLAEGTFQVHVYYWLSKIPHLYPVDLGTLFWGIKLISLYLVSIWLLSQYQFNSTCKAIIKRSAITGAVLSVLLIGMVAIDRFVIYYYTKQVDCEMPGPTCNPNCN